VAGGGGLARAAEVEAARRGNSGFGGGRLEMEAEWGLEETGVTHYCSSGEEPKEYGRYTSPRLLMGRKIQGPATRSLVQSLLAKQSGEKQMS
jgi:hypothetical protein